MTTSSDSERPWPSAAYGWYVVAILCLCNMVAFVDRQIINLLVEDIKVDLSISDTEISLLQGLAFALFYAVTAVPLGRLADTANRRWIISIGILVWTAAAAACGWRARSGSSSSQELSSVWVRRLSLRPDFPCWPISSSPRESRSPSAYSPDQHFSAPE